jgi:hypothetical protein
MKSNSARRVRLALILPTISNFGADYKSPDVCPGQRGMLTSAFRIAGIIVVASLASGPSFAQDENDGYPEDWTHHHVVFSDPETLQEASGTGSFDTWYKAVTDPRFNFQHHKRDERLPSHEDRDKDRDKDEDKKDGKGMQTTPLERDWSATLGGAGVAPGMYPAKWQFSVTNAPSCSDYVVFPVNKAGVAGSGGQPNIVAYQNLYVNAVGTGFCAGTTPTVLFSYFVGTGTVQTSPVLGTSAGLIAHVESTVRGATVTVGTLTLTASAPTPASSPIRINSTPNILGGDTITINGTVYDWSALALVCAGGGQKCVQTGLGISTATLAANLNSAIGGTCFNGACGADPTVTATVSGSTVTLTAITPGTTANADALATNDSAAIQINGAANASTTLGAGTGTLGTNGLSTTPNFQYWGGAAMVSTAVLASNISAAAAGNSANVTLAYTSGSTFTASGTGTNAGAAGNSVAIDGNLTGFNWSPSGHLAGGTNALTWTSQSASNGQTTAAEPTGNIAIIIDNVGTGAGEASIYFETLTGTGSTNSAIKMTQAALQ